MQSRLKAIQHTTAILATAFLLAGLAPSVVAFAQATPSASSQIALSEATIKALQEALAKQGIAVKADGILNDATRAAIRQYQSQHHLPVTGEPDKATLDKLGVRVSAAPAGLPTAQDAPATPQAGSSSTVGQAPASPAPQTATPSPQAPGGMMNCPMMQGQMQAMMSMMQGMMQMMQMMQGQMQPGQMQPGQMQPGQMGPGQMGPGRMPGGPMQR